MKYSLRVIIDVVLEDVEDKTMVDSVLLSIGGSENVEIEKYFSDFESGQLNEDGFKSATSIMIQGLVTNVINSKNVIPVEEHVTNIQGILFESLQEISDKLKDING